MPLCLVFKVHLVLNYMLVAMTCLRSLENDQHWVSLPATCQDNTATINRSISALRTLTPAFCSYSDLTSSGRETSKSAAHFFVKCITSDVLGELPPRIMKKHLFGGWVERRTLQLAFSLSEIAVPIPAE